MRGSSQKTLMTVCRFTIMPRPCAPVEAGPGSLIPPCTENAKILECHSCIQCGATCQTHRTAGRLRATVASRVCSARLR